MQRGGEVSLEHDALAHAAAKTRGGRQECLGVRVQRTRKDGLFLAMLYGMAKIHDQYIVCDMAYDAQIVRYEQVG